MQITLLSETNPFLEKLFLRKVYINRIRQLPVKQRNTVITSYFEDFNLIIKDFLPNLPILM